jgi:opacity protein-like surface antigen
MNQPLTVRYLRQKTLFALLIATALLPTAQADDDWLRFSGFGTVGGSWFSNANADFATNTQPSGPGRSSEFDWGLDSRLGLQIDVALSDKTTITAQAVSERNADKSIIPYLSLASLRHEFANGLTVRLGRLQPTAYLAAEYRLANFANPWTRTPETVYGLSPLVAQEAFDLSYPLVTDYGIFTGWAGFNFYDTKAPRSNASGTDNLKGRNGVYLGLKWQYAAWLAKVTWTRTELTYSNPSIDKALAAINLFDPFAKQKLAINGAPINLISLGVTYEDSDWLMMTEWAGRSSNSGLASAWGAYFTLGYHAIDTVLLYGTIGRRNAWGSHLNSQDPTANFIIQQVFASQNYSQWTGALGASYPIRETILLKCQVDWIAPDQGSYGPYTNNDPLRYNPNRPSIDTLVSVNLDFVF